VLPLLSMLPGGACITPVLRHHIQDRPWGTGCTTALTECA
jgi:hypothetical protein